MSDAKRTKITQELLKEIVKALHSIETFGSLEIYVQNSEVTQLTVRNIKKTNGGIRTPATA